MLRPPTSVASFLQRLGRSGHIVKGTPKGDIICYYDYDVIEGLALYEAARRGIIERPLIDNGLDIVARELLGMLLQYQKINLQIAYNIIHGAFAYNNLTYSEFLQLINYLVKNNIIKIEGDELKIGANFFKIWRFNKDSKIAWGKDFAEFFSLINNNDTFSLKYNGNTIGEIDSIYVFKHVRSNDVIRISGKFWKVVKINMNKATIDVIPANEVEGEIPIWKGESTSKSPIIVKFIRKLFNNIEKYNSLIDEILDEESRKALFRIINDYATQGIEIPIKNTIIVEKRDNEWIYSTLIDEKVSNTLAHLLLYLVIKKYTLNAYARSSIYGFAIRGSPTDLLKEISTIEEDKIKKMIVRSIRRSPFFIATLKEIGASFGKISKIDIKEDKFLIKEALRQTLNKYFNIRRTLKFIDKVKRGEIKIVYIDKPTPFANAVSSHVQIRPWLLDLNVTIYHALKGGAYTINELAEVLGIPNKSLENKLKQMRKSGNKYRVTYFIDVDCRETRWCLYEDFVNIVNSEEYYSSFALLNLNEIFLATLRSGDNQIEILFKPKDLLNSSDEILRKIPFNDVDEIKIKEAIDTSYQVYQKYYNVKKDIIIYLMLNAVAYLQNLKYS